MGYLILLAFIASSAMAERLGTGTEPPPTPVGAASPARTSLWSLAAQKSYELFHQSCTSLPGAITEADEERRLRALAKERTQGLGCELSQIENVLQDSDKADALAEDLATKTALILELRKKASSFEDSLQTKAAMGLASQPGSAYYKEVAEQNKILAAAESVLASIPFIDNPKMQEFVKQQIALHGGGRGPTPKFSDIEKTITGPSGALSAMRRAQADVQKNVSLLEAPQLSSAVKESLVQNAQVVTQVNGQGDMKPGDKKVACALDAKYGRGAKARDQLLLTAQVGLSLGTMGAAGVSWAATNTSLAAVRTAVTAGTIAQRTANIIGRAAVLTEIGVGTVQLAKACGPALSLGTSGTDCGQIKIEELERDNCALVAALNGLNLAGTLASIKKLSVPKQAEAVPTAKPISLSTESATARFGEYDQVKWKREKLGAMFGDNVHEIRDPAVRSTSTKSYVRYSVNPADEKVQEPYVVIDMVRGDPERAGLGQYLIKKVAEENPGKPIFGALARENGARFKTAFRDLDPQSMNSATFERALKDIPALRSIPGRARLIPNYDPAGNLIDIGVIRYPNFSQTNVTIENVDQLAADPRFRRWVNSLASRPPEYFAPNPEFGP